MWKLSRNANNSYTRAKHTRHIYTENLDFCLLLNLRIIFYFKLPHYSVYTLFFHHIYYVGAFSVFVCYFSILTKDSSCRQQLELCVKCQLSQWIWMNKCTTSHGGNKLIACAQFTNTHTHMVDMHTKCINES